MKRNHLPLLLVIMSIVPLLGAYISQYGFGMEPCIMCLYQRIPYAAIAIISLLMWNMRDKPGRMNILWWLAVLLFMVDAGLAAYHVGIEQHIFKMTSSCGSHQGTATTIEELKKQLMNAGTARCDTPAFVFLGLSMAAWNVLYALCSAGVLVLIRKKP